MITTILAAIAVVMGVAALVSTIKLRHARNKQSQLQRRVAELKNSVRLLMEHAYFDSLTGLPNRSLLADRFRLALEHSKRSQKQFAVFMVDLNHFKDINDNYGHAAGDLVLVTVGKRLVDTVRASDTVARLGGDEFVLIIEAIEERRQVVALGQKLIDVLSEKVTLETGVIVSVGGSVGFALYPENGGSMEVILDVADQAMYFCKTSGMMPLS